MRIIIGLILAGLTSGAVQAGAPFYSIRPKPRDIPALTAAHAPKVRVFYRASIRPKARGYATATAGQTVTKTSIDTNKDTTYALASTRPVYHSPRPNSRPDGLGATVAKPSGAAKTYALGREKPYSTKPTKTRLASVTPYASSPKGSVCGDPKLLGEVLPPIAAALPGCGLANPVKISSVDGVILSQGSIMDCQTAKTLRGWVTNTLIPNVRFRGGGVKSLRVPSHYSCRTRSSQPGAKISEHGKGHAIDISAIRLKNGDEITIRDGWKNRKDRRLLTKLHAGACGPFGTVLGPGSDRFHQDHFHFDTARYRGGPYCR